jgi:hypothetical protein
VGMAEPSILDARLAEIDRRLRTIQSGLGPGADPPPAESPPRGAPPATGPPAPVALHAAPPPVPDRSELIAELRELTEAHERLLAATRELLATYATYAPSAPYATAPSRPAAARPPVAPSEQISVSAGPFASTEALRAFERALVRLPEVREVAVRGYEGEDRAIVDVHLFEPTP